jgi:aerobic carbon-monoxide dehydrogenase medium subunit
VSFDYVVPDSLDEAIERLAADEDAVAIAGGTAFALLYRQGLIRPTSVVAIRHLPGLAGVEARGDGLWIGAAATHREIERSPDVRRSHPALAAAESQVATVRIRNQATLGGNLAHADPAHDPPSVLIALDAVAHLRGPGGSARQVPLDAFFVDYLATVLEPGELIIGIEVPPMAAGTRAAYHKFLPRSADDYATVAVAVAVRLDDDRRVAAARIALGAVGPTPIRATAAETALVGTVPDAAAVAQAAELARDAVDPLDDARGSAAYKRDMTRVWVRRALEGVIQ